VVRALTAGADVALFTEPGVAAAVRDAVVDAVRAGRLEEDRLDAAVEHVLTAKGVDACSLVANG
jgi:hypothetical protein